MDLEKETAFKKLCKRRLQKLIDGLVSNGISDNEKKIIELLLEISAGFRAVDLNEFMNKTNLSEEEARILLGKISYKKDNKLVEVFRVSTIRGKRGIYLSQECGQDL